MRFLYVLIVLLFFPFVSFSNDTSPLSIKPYLNKFQKLNIYDTINDYNIGDKLDSITLKRVFDVEIFAEDSLLEGYAYGDLIQFEKHILITLIHYVTPGAFGVENYYIELFLFDDNGFLIDDKLAGCYCRDINMSTNDYYKQEILIIVEKATISIINTYTHATLFFEQTNNPFEEIEIQKAVFKILPDSTKISLSKY